MKIVVAGKGGVGKTTVSGTIARAFARAGHNVLALDADTNRMLGGSLGVGPEETDLLVAVRQGLEPARPSTSARPRASSSVSARRARRRAAWGRIADRAGEPRLHVLRRLAQSLLRELESEGKMSLGDLEAGVGP